ncbi:hypothetical protein E4U55_003484 [Claviceps digitariae]|nr:hypothetical protein E4U55_003484 [Claviceps digitariae]
MALPALSAWTKKPQALRVADWRTGSQLASMGLDGTGWNWRADQTRRKLTFVGPKPGTVQMRDERQRVSRR